MTQDDIQKKADHRAEQAAAIEQTVRETLVEEVDKIDGDSVEKLTMVAVVALGTAKEAIEAVVSAADGHRNAARPMIMAVNWYVDNVVGPHLIALNKLHKEVK